MEVKWQTPREWNRGENYKLLPKFLILFLIDLRMNVLEENILSKV